MSTDLTVLVHFPMASPTRHQGGEREIGTYMDKLFAMAGEAGTKIGVGIAGPAGARDRMVEYAKFVRWTERSFDALDATFDYQRLMTTEKPS